MLGKDYPRRKEDRGKHFKRRKNESGSALLEGRTSHDKAERRYLTFVAETDALKKLEEDTNGRHYLIRKMHEIAKSGRKTVVISIDKDNKPFTAKVETTKLYNREGSYGDYVFAGKDKEAYCALYGNGWNDFKVEDIVSISYSGKEI